MGKSKGSQRTKGNARPSSSGRSAELLGSSGKLGFVGFSACKIGQYVSQESEADIDGTFSMVMKKMLKRDATTKLKAIQEYKDLVSTKDEETVLSILPFWPRLYNKLSLDFDRRIREATQDANAKLIERVKREIAPYLKNISGVWLLSQCDSYAPASSLAKSTFLATFPVEKQSEALMFCKEQILAYFTENLFEHTPQTLAEQNMSTEEMENKYILVLSGTLHGLRLFISTISIDDKKSVSNNVKAIIVENKFWKHGKSKNPQVRVAWYNLVSILCQFMPSVFENYEHKLGCAVLGHLSESDPVVATAVWEAALNYVVSFQNCWETIDAHKVVLPQLWALLKGGGKGNASLVYPCLLPFLSQLPQKVTKDKPRFFVEFFDSIIQSLFLESVKVSTIECNAIITAYIECLQYMCLQYKEESDKTDLIKELICDQLLLLIKKSFTSQGVHLPISKFYQVLGVFLQRLDQTISKDSNSAIHSLQQIVSQFWQSTFDVCSDVIKNEQLAHCTNFAYLAYFIHCVLEPLNNSSKKKRKHKVRFTEEISDVLEDCDLTPQSSNPPPLNSGRADLFQFTVKFGHLLCLVTSDKFNSHCMKLLCETLTAAHSPNLFQAILQELGTSTKDSKDAPLLFFKTSALNWIQRTDLDKAIVQSLVDIVFLLCSCVEATAAMEILDSCSQIESPLFLNGLLQRGLSILDDNLFGSWLRNKKASLTVLHLLKFIADSLSPESSNSVVLSSLNDFSSTVETFIKSISSQESAIDLAEALLMVKGTFEQYLALCEKCQLNSSVLNAMFNICQSILLNHKECWCLPVTNDLMVVLFDCCILQNPTLSEELRSNLLIWSLKSINYLPHWRVEFYHQKGFVFQAVSKLHAFIVNRKPNVMLTPLLETVSLLFEELELLVKSEDESDIDGNNFLSDVLCQILLSENEWTQLKIGLQLNIIPVYLEKKLLYPLPENMAISATSESIPSYVLVAELVSEIISKLFSRKVGKYSSVILAQFMKQLPHLIWSFSYCENCGYLKEEDTDEYSCATSLQMNYFQMLILFPKEELFVYLRILYIMCQESSFNWEIPFQNTLQIIQTFYPADIPAFLDDFLFREGNNVSEHHLIRQILIQHLTSESKISFLKKSMEFIISTNNTLDLVPLSELCCCLQDEDVLKSTEIHVLLENVLSHLLAHESTLELQSEIGMLQATLITPFLGYIVENAPNMLSTIMWDYIFRNVVASLKHCLEIKENICTSPLDLIFAHRTFSFICLLLSTYSEESERTSFTATQKTNFDKCSELLLIIFCKLSDICDRVVSLPKPVESVLTAMSQTIEFLPSDSLLSAVLNSVTLISDENKKDSGEEIKFPLQSFLKFLTSSLRPLQLGNHTVLMKSMCLLPSLLGTNEEKDDLDENVEINKRLLPLIELLEYTTQIVESMLCDIEIGECCLVLPNTDSYTYTLAYLFAWSEFLEFLAASSIQERSTYIEYLEKGNLFKSLLSNLLRLMPEKLVACYKNADKENMSIQDILKTIFSDTPIISLLDPPSVEDIQYMACNTYYSTLKKIPAVVRMWWNNLDKCNADSVNKFTSKYISSFLTMKELQAIHESDIQFSNMTTRARYVTREVIATYTIDGSIIELTIQLPTNYPLGPVTIHDGGHVKIAKPEWRHWLMQLTAFLTYQNGSMLDGLLLWKKNLDKKFEGVEECMICFYILHNTTAKLPQRSCHTCKKKFHIDCIYKWFVTSNNSTCPLCRCYF